MEEGQGAALKPARGLCPIGVNLPPDGVTDMWCSFSPGVGEPAVDIGSGVQQIIDGEAAEDSKQQHAPGNVPRAPERGDVGWHASKVLRGKTPGIPG